MDYKELVAAVGPGFHPDTPASEYNMLPAGLTVREFEQIVLNAQLRGVEYKEAWEVFAEQGWIKA